MIDTVTSPHETNFKDVDMMDIQDLENKRDMAAQLPTMREP